MDDIESLLERADSIISSYETRLAKLNEELERKRNDEKQQLKKKIIEVYSSMSIDVDTGKFDNESVETLKILLDNALIMAEKYQFMNQKSDEDDEITGVNGKKLGDNNEMSQREYMETVLDMISYSMGLPIASDEEKETLRLEHAARGLIY